MSKNDGFLHKLCGIAAVAAVIYGAVRVADESRQNDAAAFTKLLKRQAVYDVLTEDELRKWFLEKAKKHSADVRFIVSKATTKNAKLFAISSLPKDLDREHTFFQAVVNDEGKVFEIRIVSCASLSDKLTKQFEREDIILM